MMKAVLACGVAVLAVTAAIAGERSEVTGESRNLVFFSGGVPALEIRSNSSNTACIFEGRKAAQQKPTKLLFAVY